MASGSQSSSPKPSHHQAAVTTSELDTLQLPNLSATGPRAPPLPTTPRLPLNTRNPDPSLSDHNPQSLELPSPHPLIPPRCLHRPFPPGFNATALPPTMVLPWHPQDKTQFCTKQVVHLTLSCSWAPGALGESQSTMGRTESPRMLWIPRLTTLSTPSLPPQGTRAGSEMSWRGSETASQPRSQLGEHSLGAASRCPEEALTGSVCALPPSIFLSQRSIPS